MTLTGLAELSASLAAAPPFFGVHSTAGGCTAAAGGCMDVEADPSDPGLLGWRCMLGPEAPVNGEAYDSGFILEQGKYTGGVSIPGRDLQACAGYGMYCLMQGFASGFLKASAPWVSSHRVSKCHLLGCCALLAALQGARAEAGRRGSCLRASQPLQ